MIASLRSLLANNSLEAPFSVLDLGTGNGLLLHTLLDAELTPPARMMGIDYSEGSVTLAREVAEARGEGAEEIRWEQCDCVDDEEAVKRLGEWDVLLDKGTVSLVAASVHRKRAGGRASRRSYDCAMVLRAMSVAEQREEKGRSAASEN